MPTSYHYWCGKREEGAHWLVHSDAKAAPVRYWNYLEDYWPCAGGLSAVNVIRTQLRDPINSRPTRWRMAVKINTLTPPRKSHELSTIFSVSTENE